MFSSFGESNKDLVIIKKIDFPILNILIDFIYTGKIIITQENVQVQCINIFELLYINVHKIELN